MAPHRPENIQQRLQHALQQRDINMSSLAYALGVSKSSVSDWLRGGGLSMTNAAAIAVELNISLDWLLLGKGSMDLFGPLHPTVTEMQLVHNLRNAGKPAFDTFFNLLQNLARPVLGDDPFSQIVALEMLEKSRMAMAVVSHEGYILDANEACLDILGDDLDKTRDVIGSHFAEWINADDLPSALQHMETGMREGFNSHFPARIQRKSHSGKYRGEKLYIDIVISAVFHDTSSGGHFECAVFPLD